MDKVKASSSCILISEEGTDSLYPIYVGVSCGFVVLKLLSRSEFNDGQWLDVRNKLFQGTAHLLGMLMWETQRREAVVGKSELLCNLTRAQMEVRELKRQRREDAKANEKVVSIFASQEQNWFSHKKTLEYQIRDLINQWQVQKKSKEEIILNFNEKVKEKEFLIQAKDKALEEAEEKIKEVKKKLQTAEAVAVGLRETIDNEAQKHTSELLKHKTTFVELISNQRQLEAEMGRTLRQVEEAEQELDSVLKQKEDSVSMVHQLSVEVLRIRKDAEQKEKILSAMLRKSKLDTAEKEMLLQEVRISKAKRRQVQHEMEKYRALYESRHEKNSSRSNLFSRVHSRSEVFSGAKGSHSIEASYLQNRTTNINSNAYRNNTRTILLDHAEVDHKKEWDCMVPEKIVNVVSESSIGNPSERRIHELITTDIKQLEGWVRFETEKNAVMLEQRHKIEIDAFAEQLTLKDEKIEAFRWQLLSMELKSKRSQSHTDCLDKNLSDLRKENMELEALLLDREAEMRTLNKELKGLHGIVKKSSLKNMTEDHKAIWSEVKIIKTQPSEDLQTKCSSPQEVDCETEEDQIPVKFFVETNSIVEVPEREIEEEKEVAMDTCRYGKEGEGSEKPILVPEIESYKYCLNKKDITTWKADLRSLGVSYNIKRLKQQLLLLDKLVGMSRSSKTKDFESNSHLGTKGFMLLMSLLNKQVSRYQSLHDMIDDLLNRMHENGLGDLGEGSRSTIKLEETKTLEDFLQETVQLQRDLVATGQKLVEIQSRIASRFTTTAEETNRSSSFDMNKFTDSVRTIFKDIQKGLEVRIARLMGDLEVTLACNGIMHS